MKKIFTLLLLCVLCLNTSAQSSTNKIVLSIAPNTTEVQFAVKLDGATSYSIDFGEGEGVKTFENTIGEFITTKYTFASPKTEEREITLDATNIITLRSTNSKAINGIKEIISDKIKDIGFVSTSLNAYSSLDMSQCPALVNAVFIGSNLEIVKLPAGKTLESIQISASWSGEKKSLKAINLNDAEGLKSILITDAILTEVDLTKQKNIETLCIYNPNKIGLRRIKGAKDLKKITRLNLNGNNLGFDQIPDRYVDEAPLEQFQYTQTYYYLDKSKINNTTIDLSHLLKAKGIATSEQFSSFKWVWKAKKSDKFTDVPQKYIKEEDGKFTLDPTPLNTDKFIVAVRMTNPGYPEIGGTKKYLQSYNITLTKGTTNDIENISTKESVNIVVTSDGVLLNTENPSQVSIFNVNGKKVWEGIAPANVSLQKGVYILKTAHRNTKFVR
ncbi:MAG: hypothetical protein ACTTHI_06435 [Prevotella sp.]